MGFVLVFVPIRLFKGLWAKCELSDTLHNTLELSIRRALCLNDDVTIVFSKISFVQSYAAHYRYTACKKDVLLMQHKYKMYVINEGVPHKPLAQYVYCGNKFIYKMHNRCLMRKSGNFLNSYDDICKYSLGGIDHPNHLCVSTNTINRSDLDLKLPPISDTL